MLWQWLNFRNPVLIASLVPKRGFDWVQWENRDGRIVAVYVFTKGSAYYAGIREGDVFTGFADRTIFRADDLKQIIAGIPPGSVLRYEILRNNNQQRYFDVTITDYPDFLYPLTGIVWQLSVGAFSLIAFLHFILLGIVAPIALRTRESRFIFALVVSSALWTICSALRMLMLWMFGPAYAQELPLLTFNVLTFVSLYGWVLFPAILMHKTLSDLPQYALLSTIWKRLIYLPAMVLLLSIFWISTAQNLANFNLSIILPAVLFYANFYLLVSALLRLLSTRKAQENLWVERWNELGTKIWVASATFSFVGVCALLGFFGEGLTLSDQLSGSLIVMIQLLPLFPLFLLATSVLKYGKTDTVLIDFLTYAVGLGIVFFMYILGIQLLSPLFKQVETSPQILTGFFVLFLILFFERLMNALKRYVGIAVLGERQLARRVLVAFGEEIRNIHDHQTLVEQSLGQIVSGIRAKSGVLYLRPNDEANEWVHSTHQPEAPFFTAHHFNGIWQFFEQERRLWARKTELNEARFPQEVHEILQLLDLEIGIPILTDKKCIGLLLLGKKRRKNAVYNVEDLALLQNIASQVALASERISLIERERNLIRQNAEAELVALRAQINPHFLFNALNTIAALIDENPKEAEAKVEDLAVIFRYVLQVGSRSFVPLSEEIALVQRYLAIEKARFGKKLDIEIQYPNALSDFQVPAFAIQTLVENAIKHGLEKRRKGGKLSITALENKAQVVVEVHDSGQGIPELFGDGEKRGLQPFYGIGLRNVHARLTQLYGRSDLLSYESDPENGTTARLYIQKQ